MNQRRIGASFAAALLLALASLPACKSTTGPSQRVVPVKDAAEEAKKPAADDRAHEPPAPRSALRRKGRELLS